MRDCVKRIVETSNGAVSVSEAKLLLADVDKLAKRKVQMGEDYSSAVKSIMKERAVITKENSIKAKQNIARNIILRAELVDRVSTLMTDGKMDAATALRAELEGVISNLENTKVSLDAFKMQKQHFYAGQFFGDMSKEGLMEIFNKRVMETDIANELFEISYGRGGATKNKTAFRIAEIIDKYNKKLKDELNLAGADIRDLAGWAIPQRHDLVKMTKMGVEKWSEFMEPLMDWNKSFGGTVTDRAKVLNAAYEAMLTGIRRNDPFVRNEKMFQFSGPANLGKRLSQEREIHFLDFASWKKWDDNLGTKNLGESVIDHIMTSAENLAIMQRYGTNAEALLKDAVDKIALKHREEFSKTGQTAKEFQDKAQKLIDYNLGKNRIAVSPKLAEISGLARIFNDLTLMGGAGISAIFGDPMIKALTYHGQGKNWLESTTQAFADTAMSFKSRQEQVHWAKLTGVYVESMVSGVIAGRHSAVDSTSIKASKLQRLMYKFNLLSGWTDGHKIGMARTMSHDLGLKAELPFSALGEDMQRLFGNHGITEADWDVMRKSVAIEPEDGRAYVLQDNISDRDVADKLMRYIIDQQELGVLTPGAREKRILSGGFRAGTPEGETIKLIGQYKAYPLTAITKVWGTALYAKGKADVPAIAYLLSMSIVFGYMATTAKDLIAGKTPKNPKKPETWFAAMAQGGGLGIAGDLLLNDGGKFGRSASSILAGPTLGRIDDVFKIYGAGIRGGGSSSQLLRTATSSIPFSNLWFIKPALNQAVILPLQEEMNAGYINRMESNMNKTYGQKLLFK